MKENKTPLQGTVMNLFFIYIGVKPILFQLLYGSYPPILAIDSSKQANDTRKTESVKTEQSVVICIKRKLLNSEKYEKIGRPG